MRRMLRNVVALSGLALLVVLVSGLVSCGPEKGVFGEEPGTGVLGEMSDWDKRTDLVSTGTVDPSVFSSGRSSEAVVEGSLIRGSVDLAKGGMEYYSSQVSDAAAVGQTAPESGPLAVVDHGPVGELPAEMRKPTIYVMFNHPVVPLAKLGEPIRDSQVMRIDPPVAGTWRWYGTRALSFEPDGLLTEHPRYRVTVAGSTKSLGSNALGSDFNFEFFTEAVAIVNHYPGTNPDDDLGTENVPLQAARHMILEFNQEVDPGHLKQFLTAKVGTKSVGFSLGRPAYPERLKTRLPRGVLLTVDGQVPENTTVTVTLADKASPRPGFPPRKGEMAVSIESLEPFRLDSIESYSWDVPRDNKANVRPVYLDFTHELDAASIAGKFSPTVNGKAVKPESVTAFDDVVRVNLVGAGPGDSVRVALAKGIRDVNGRELAPVMSDVLEIPEPEAYIDFPSKGLNHLEASYPPKFIWEARNLLSAELGFATGSSWYLDPPSVKAEKVDMSSWTRNKVRYELVDLKALLQGKSFGTVFAYWKASYKNSWNNKIRNDQESFAIQVTNMGITTRYAWNRILVWVNTLKDGTPVQGAKVSLMNRSGVVKETVSDSNGLATFPLESGEFVKLFSPAPNEWQLPLFIGAEKDGDRVELPVADTHPSWGSSMYAHTSPLRAEEAKARIFMFTDRGLYKAGEEIAFRGIHWNQGPLGFEPWRGAYSVEATTVTGYGDEEEEETVLWSASGTASFSGGFSHRFTLPKDLKPGSYRLVYRAAPDVEEEVRFTIAQFRRLAFQVRTTVGDRPFYQGDEVSAEVKASYLAGGAMPNAKATWYWTRKPVPFSPPGLAWKNWAFGPGLWEGEHTLSNGEQNLSSAGSLVVRSPTADQNADGAAYRYTLETTVADVDRQAIASTASVMVHPASFYLGARFASDDNDGWWSRFIPTNSNTKLQLALAGLDGRALADSADVKATLILGEWKATQQQGVYGRIQTRWDYVETEVQKRDLKLNGGKAELDFQVKDPGTWRWVVEARDGRNRMAKTTIKFYATGSAWVRQASETPSSISMMVDKELYLPGETARILVQSPLPKGRYLLSVEREGILEEKVIELDGSQKVIEVPVKAEYLPVFYVALSSFTARQELPADYFEPDIGRPRGLFGITGVRVSTRPVELDVEVKALADSYKPGETAEVAVRVTRGGQPVANAELTLVAVDRGVLDLINYHIPDPLDFFYDPYNFPLGVRGDDSRRLLLKPVTYDTSSLTGGDGDKLEQRKDFRPLALFEPFVATDANGMAKVSFKLPDNLTTYRLTVMAIRDFKVGIQEGELLVKNPINVRTALPRRFRVRDTAGAGVVLHNLSSVEQKVKVSAESDLLKVGGETTREISIPAGSVYELPFVLVADRPGEGTISFTIRSSILNEKLTEKVVVDRPLVKEAFSTIGSLDAETPTAQEGLVLASRIAPGYGSLDLMLASSLRPWIQPSLNRLLDAEPWWGIHAKVEQSFAAAFQGGMDGTLDMVMAELKSRQLANGGIHGSSLGSEWLFPDLWLSMRTVHLGNWAGLRGYKGGKGPDMVRLGNYLKNLDTSKLSPGTQSYLAYVLALAGHTSPKRLGEVEALGDKLGLLGYGYLAQSWLVLKNRDAAKRVYDRSKNFVLIGTQSVDIKETYEARDYWSSMVAELALLMKNAIELGEDMGFVQRVAGSLNRNTRYWYSRNDDVSTILAFAPLIDAETTGGAMQAQVSLGGQPLAAAALSKDAPVWKGSLEFNKEPLAGKPRDTVLDLAFSRPGTAPLYYTTILRYALPNETAGPRDEGLEVVTRWETLDGTVVKDGQLVLGETYRVRSWVSTTKRRANLELLVPVPSGVEISDPSMVTTGKFAPSGGVRSESWEVETSYGDTMTVLGEGYGDYDEGFWSWYWYQPDVRVHDSMMAYRWQDFAAGQREVSFVVRVTSPGIFPTPPAQASLVFEPEVFGRSEGRLFVVKP